MLRVTVPDRWRTSSRSRPAPPIADAVPPARPRQEVRQEVHRPQRSRRSSAPSCRRCPTRRPRSTPTATATATGSSTTPTPTTTTTCCSTRREGPALGDRPVQRATPTATGSRTATSTSRRATSTTTSTRTRTRFCPTPASGRTRTRSTTDAGIDYDGDTLTLGRGALALAVHLRTAPPRRRRALDAGAALTYSDGSKYSVYASRAATAAARRRWPPPATTRSSTSTAGCTAPATGPSSVPDYPSGAPAYNGLLDVNRDGSTSTATAGQLPRSEAHYLDSDAQRLALRRRARRGRRRPHELRRDPRPHDPGYWCGVLPARSRTTIAYAGTELDDADTDGDGVRDGADDQDHDDVPNLMELSRNAVTGAPGGSAGHDAVAARRPGPGVRPRAAVQPLRAVRRLAQLPDSLGAGPLRPVRRASVERRRRGPDVPGPQLSGTGSGVPERPALVPGARL